MGGSLCADPKSRHGCKARLSQDPQIIKALQDSVDVLFDHLAQGWYVYGRLYLYTGFEAGSR